MRSDIISVVIRIEHGLQALTRLPAGAVLSVGNYDGVHLGHRALLQRCRSLASSGIPIAVATFDPHPLTVLRPELSPPSLATPDEKARLLEELGVSHLVVLPPDPSVLNLSAEAFWGMLRNDVRPSHLVEGNNFTFGKDRRGTTSRLIEWSAESDVRLTVVEPVRACLSDLSVVPVSSSLIRWLLGHGRVRDAAVCLGRAYSLRGTVVEGFKRGRTIGVPTANLRVDRQMSPLEGVYAGRATIDGTTYPAAVNVGPLPTFDPVARQVEAHLVGFDGDLYGRTIAVELTDWLREQQKFDGIDGLVKQISRDIAESVDRAGRDPARAIGGEKCAN